MENQNKENCVSDSNTSNLSRRELLELWKAKRDNEKKEKKEKDQLKKSMPSAKATTAVARPICVSTSTSTLKSSDTKKTRANSISTSDISKSTPSHGRSASTKHSESNTEKKAPNTYSVRTAAERTIARTHLNTATPVKKPQRVTLSQQQKQQEELNAEQIKGEEEFLQNIEKQKLTEAPTNQPCTENTEKSLSQEEVNQIDSQQMPEILQVLNQEQVPIKRTLKGLYLFQTVEKGILISSEKVFFHSRPLFTLQCTADLARNGEIEASRSVFDLLLASGRGYRSHSHLQGQGSKFCGRLVEFKTDAIYWTTRAVFEEQYGSIELAQDSFLKAEQYEAKPLQLIQEAKKWFDKRQEDRVTRENRVAEEEEYELSTPKEPKAKTKSTQEDQKKVNQMDNQMDKQVQEEEELVFSNDPPQEVISEEMAKHAYTEIRDSFGLSPKPFIGCFETIHHTTPVPTPQLRSLVELPITTPTTVTRRAKRVDKKQEETEVEVHQSKTPSLKTPRKLRHHSEELEESLVEGSSVVQFAQITPSKKMKDILGTEIVFTPVRRSTRIKTKQTRDTLTVDDLASIEASTDYAFVPNQLVQTPVSQKKKQDREDVCDSDRLVDSISKIVKSNKNKK